LPLLEFIVHGTPISSQGASGAKRLWQKLVREAAMGASAKEFQSSTDEMTLRVAYFYVNEAAADLDNIVKPIQDALQGLVYDDDEQVVDLIASMRRKEVDDSLLLTPTLARGFQGGSDFIYVSVDRSTATIEVFR
jgi:crossover junction endodeoxyribonuclease RusA